jgi:hypothetical protein
MATAFPTEWGRTGQEGLVVEFVCMDGSSWVGNFCPGRYGSLTDDVRWDPDRHQVLVTSAGTVRCVTPETRMAKELAQGIFGVWRMGEPDSLVFNY